MPKFFYHLKRYLMVKRWDLPCLSYIFITVILQSSSSSSVHRTMSRFSNFIFFSLCLFGNYISIRFFSNYLHRRISCLNMHCFISIIRWIGDDTWTKWIFTAIAHLQNVKTFFPKEDYCRRKLPHELTNRWIQSSPILSKVEMQKMTNRMLHQDCSQQ